MAHLYRDAFTRPLAASALALGLGLAATPAYARQQPVAPPSGVVIHLFGPNSLASQLMSTGPGPAPAGTAAAGTPAGSAPSGQTATSAADTATGTTSGATWGDVAHKMFVTGDPAQEGAAALSKGKAGD